MTPELAHSLTIFVHVVEFAYICSATTAVVLVIVSRFL